MANYAELLVENARLKSRVAELQQTVQTLQHQHEPRLSSSPRSATEASNVYSHHGLTNDQIFRYSRQLLVSEFGQSPSQSQRALLSSSVLVIGAGGLGCPVILYLAAAGVGHIGIVDNDVIDVSNLHRQVCHSESSVGQSKAQSAANAAQRVSGQCRTTVFNQSFSLTNALSLVDGYDCIVDCSDNVATRYLCNDIGVLTNKPIISGSALRMEGQLTVYHYGDGPCYRCLYPKPPPAAMVTNCSDGGVIGAITGVIGTLQALETIKICVLLQHPCTELETLSGRLLLFDGTNTAVRTVKLRGKSATCAVCSNSASITVDYITTHLTGYVHQCGSSIFHDRETETPSFAKVQTIRAKQLPEKLNSERAVLLDVRPAIQFDICHLPLAINLPLKQIQDMSKEALNQFLSSHTHTNNNTDTDADNGSSAVYVMCRRGIDSLAATSLIAQHTDLTVINVEGGLTAWARDVDPNCPIY